MAEKYQYPPGTVYTGIKAGAQLVGVASTPIIGRNLNRLTLTIANDGATDVYLAKGETGALLNAGLPLRAMVGVYQCGRGVDDKYCGAICAISSAPCNVTFTEDNTPED